ncbi:hypothetical protein, partial [Agrobacterium tumefaciens]|uniref:hypothetical protein n=1 Tax=Agrobacterium tumefaciens TaxID=358 RepID=UPI003BA2B0D2
VFRTGISPCERCKLLFLQKDIQLTDQSTHTGRSAVGHHWPARLERRGKAATASRHNLTNRASDWWS